MSTSYRIVGNPGPVVSLTEPPTIYNWNTSHDQWPKTVAEGGEVMFSNIPAGSYELKLHFIAYNSGEHGSSIITTPDADVQFGAGWWLGGENEYSEMTFFISTATAGAWRFASGGGVGQQGSLGRVTASMKSL
jgi:hypothetical protein